LSRRTSQVSQASQHSHASQSDGASFADIASQLSQPFVDDSTLAAQSVSDSCV
jgi:hypothetical protein